MTTEQKAKAYDEALERARNYYNGIGPCRAKDELEKMFPQLRESEDERIRRTLVEYFGPQAQLDFIRGVPIQKIRDWLEKQKEQKPAEWNEEDEAHRNFILESLEDQIRFCKKDAEGAYYAKQIRTAQNWLKAFKPSWKPSEEQMKAFQCAIAFMEIRKASDYDISPLKSLYEQLKKLM